jgi:hypothetical protein
MQELKEIPLWMQKYIPMITEYVCKDENDLRTRLDFISKINTIRIFDIISIINAKIELLETLEKKHLL